MKCRTGEGTKTHPGLFVHLVLEVAEGPADLGHALPLSVAAQRARLFLRYTDAHNSSPLKRETAARLCTRKPVCSLPVCCGRCGGLTCMLVSQRCWTRTSHLQRSKREKTAAFRGGKHSTAAFCCCCCSSDYRATAASTGPDEESPPPSSCKIPHRDLSICTFLSWSQALNVRWRRALPFGGRPLSLSGFRFQLWSGNVGKWAGSRRVAGTVPERCRNALEQGAQTPDNQSACQRSRPTPQPPHVSTKAQISTYLNQKTKT